MQSAKSGVSRVLGLPAKLISVPEATIRGCHVLTVTSYLWSSLQVRYARAGLKHGKRYSALLSYLYALIPRDNAYNYIKRVPSEKGRLSRQPAAQECLRPLDLIARKVATVVDDLGPIRPQIALF
jgi:hypothetical protein